MILLFHTIVEDGAPIQRYYKNIALKVSLFKRQMRWLSKYYHIVSMDEYVDELLHSKIRNPKSICISFDDGYKNTFQQILPVLSELKIPITIFTTTGHLNHGKLLWFNYLKALCFERQYNRISWNDSVLSLATLNDRANAWNFLMTEAINSKNSEAFRDQLEEIFPLSSDITCYYEGMTYTQIRDAARTGLVEIGAHTLTHPFLSRLSKQEQIKEINESRNLLSELVCRPINYFAYPSGDYNKETIQVVKSGRFKAAFSVTPRKLSSEIIYEIGRMGVYSPSIFKLRLKTIGFAEFLRDIGIRVG